MRSHAAAQVACVIGITTLAIGFGGNHNLTNLTVLFVLAGFTASLTWTAPTWMGTHSLVWLYGRSSHVELPSSELVRYPNMAQRIG